MPAIPPSTALYTKVSMIIPATGMPRSAGHLLVLRGRLQLLADQGMLEEPVLEGHQRRSYGDDQQVLAVEVDRAEQKALCLEDGSGNTCGCGP